MECICCKKKRERKHKVRSPFHLYTVRCVQQGFERGVEAKLLLLGFFMRRSCLLEHIVISFSECRFKQYCLFVCERRGRRAESRKVFQLFERERGLAAVLGVF